MMRSSRVAKRYARALLELADRGQVEAWGAELARLAALVETPEMLERVRVAGLNHAQGIGVSRPLPLEEALTALEAA